MCEEFSLIQGTVLPCPWEMHQSARHMVQHWKLVSLGKLFSITIFFKISLGSETVATLDRGALNVLSTRIARQGR